MADDDGQCNEANYAGFEVPVPAYPGTENENTCARQVQSLQDECADAFGWGRFSEDLYVGTTGTVSPSVSFDGGDYIQVSNAEVLTFMGSIEVWKRGRGGVAWKKKSTGHAAIGRVVGWGGVLWAIFPTKFHFK